MSTNRKVSELDLVIQKINGIDWDNIVSDLEKDVVSESDKGTGKPKPKANP